MKNRKKLIILFLVIGIFCFFIFFAYRVIYINNKYDKVIKINHETDEYFKFNDMEMAVKNGYIIEDDEFLHKFGDNAYAVKEYEESVKKLGLGLFVIEVDVRGLTKEGYNKLLNLCIDYGVSGNGVNFLTDLINPIPQDEPEDKIFYLFFRGEKDSLENLRGKRAKLIINAYPVLERVYIDVK